MISLVSTNQVDSFGWVRKNRNPIRRCLKAVGTWAPDQKGVQVFTLSRDTLDSSLSPLRRAVSAGQQIGVSEFELRTV